MGSRYGSLFQINTRVWLTELSRGLGRRATLDDIPEAELYRLSEDGFEWNWMLSVWQTGLAAQRISRDNLEWRHEFENTLPDLRDRSFVAGSPTDFYLQFMTEVNRPGAGPLRRPRETS